MSYTLLFFYWSLGKWLGLMQIATIALVTWYFVAGGLAFCFWTLLVLSVTATTSNILYWRARGKLDLNLRHELLRSDTPAYLERILRVRPHKQRQKTSVWEPLITVDHIKKRGLATVGSTLMQSVTDIFTWAFEYKAQIVYRVLKFDLGFRRSHRAEHNYMALTNSSAACYLDYNTGNIVTFDTLFFHEHKSKRYWHKITFELDHERATCTRAIVQESKDSRKIILDDPVEVGILALMFVSTKSHVHIHLFGNGVAELLRIWPLAETSSSMVQALNFSAVFSWTDSLLDCSNEVLADIIGNNITSEGLPQHNKIPTHVLAKSLTHRMTQKARRALLKEESLNLSPHQVESILAATIMHSADHYYVDKFVGDCGRSGLLKTDFTLFRAAVIAPNHYFTAKLLCRQHPNDTICKSLYEAAKEVDVVFADKALFLSIVN